MAHIETHSNEKDGSLQSSVNQNARVGAGGAARNLDERRRAALSHIDNAAFSLVLFCLLLPSVRADLSLRSWFHVKVICVAGVGFFADA
jgi:hypothetical protein